MNNEEMIKKIAESAQAFSEPIDFEKLIKEGTLTRKGRSFYVKDIHSLPERVSKRIKEAVPTKNGLRVTFYKESKKLKKIASQLSDYLE